MKIKNTKQSALYSVVVAMCISLLSACSDTQPSAPDEGKTGAIVLEFDNVVGLDELTLGKEYTNEANEKFTPSILKYYITNIALQTASGTTYTVPKGSSYFLVDEADKTSQKITISNVPEGDYTDVSFTIGVDSLSSTSPIESRTGALDMGGLGKDMYWDWNSGYIFFKMEGESPAITEVEQNFRFHIGGFGGYSKQTINNIKKATISLGSTPATVRAEIKPEVHLVADIMKVFSGAKTISLAVNASYMFSANSVDIANNYVNMFSFDHVHNEQTH